VATGTQRSGRIVMSQACDVIGFAALAVVLDAPLDGKSWALLIVPVVSAAVRLSATAAMASWLAACALVFASAVFGPHSSDGLNGQLLGFGVLLAVAVSVGLLARWMREGWEIQNELTRAAVDREHRAAVIERAIRALLDADADRTLEIAGRHVIELGFESVTAHEAGTEESRIALGRPELISDLATLDALEPGEVLITLWTDDGRIRAHSASTLEPRTGTIVTGWSARQIDEGLAGSLATLTAHLTVANQTKQLISSLHDRATRDPLTGLANRAGFDAAVDARCALDVPTSLMFLDLDDFKRLNDDYGHSTGDIVLQAIATRLEEIVGDRGLVGRFGGDEFVVLLFDDDMAVVEQVAGDVVRCGQECIEFNTGRLGSRLSVGAAISPGAFRPAELVRAADAAMYRAKSSGGNRSSITVLGSAGAERRDDGQNPSGDTTEPTAVAR
jgi:diguanylate cyclase (GGDEF)-like protein